MLSNEQQIFNNFFFFLLMYVRMYFHLGLKIRRLNIYILDLQKCLRPLDIIISRSITIAIVEVIFYTL